MPNNTNFSKGHQGFTTVPAVDRFWPKIRLTPTCWYWQGTILSLGYGQFYYRGKKCLAHRFAYELLKGRISKGLVIDHLCLHKKCVNPLHLDMVTHKENTQRYHNLKTHCPSKHPYSGTNLYINPQGLRKCRFCRAKSAKKWREKCSK